MTYQIHQLEYIYRLPRFLQSISLACKEQCTAVIPATNTKITSLRGYSHADTAVTCPFGSAQKAGFSAWLEIPHTIVFRTSWCNTLGPLRVLRSIAWQMSPLQHVPSAAALHPWCAVLPF